MTVQPGDKITAEWANSLYDPMRSMVGEGIIDKDGFAACVGANTDTALRRFVLVDALNDENESTTARVLFYDADEDEYTAGAEADWIEFELFSFAGFTGNIGAKGWCIERGGRWEVVSIRGYDRIKGLADDDFETTDGTFTIDNVSVIKGADPRSDTSSTSEQVTVYNDHSWAIDNNSIVRAEYNIDSGHWEAYQVTCPA